MKKLTCFLLTLLLLVSLATPVALAAGSRFSDVPAGAWFAEAVDWAVDAQITQGTGADTFSPDEGCTRAQIVTFLYRAAGEAENPAPASSAFSDVAPEAYYAGPIAWAVAKGVTVGTGETTFSPNDTCTRAQIVTFLFRAAGSPAASAYDGSFSDVAASAYYAQAVQWAVAQGITKGTGEGQFSPDKTCTSHSSPLGTSAETLKGLLGEDVTWLPSRRFAAGTGEEPLAAWLTEIGLLAK